MEVHKNFFSPYLAALSHNIAKLLPGDLLMMDNYRLLHGRTKYDASEGNRFLQGCYIDYDSTEGRLKHLKRKFDN